MTEATISMRPAEDTGRRSFTGWGTARRRARAAQDAEFTAFVESAGTRLRRSAFLMCRDWHSAQDLTQQTLTKMYAAWPRIRTSAHLEAYSRKVLMNLVFDHSKRRSASEVVLAELPEHADRANGAPEVRLALIEALAKLSVKDQAVLVLRHAEDHSIDTVAMILNVSVSVVKMRNARALARLRTLLGDDFRVTD